MDGLRHTGKWGGTDDKQHVLLDAVSGWGTTGVQTVFVARSTKDMVTSNTTCSGYTYAVRLDGLVFPLSHTHSLSHCSIVISFKTKISFVFSIGWQLKFFLFSGPL